jgi:hypothetical protein
MIYRVCNVHSRNHHLPHMVVLKTVNLGIILPIVHAPRKWIKSELIIVLQWSKMCECLPKNLVGLRPKTVLIQALSCYGCGQM